MSDTEIKQQVRQFYDEIGWQKVSEDQFQNASHEDLRPVSREYIHRCHLRVGRYLKPSGRFLLDAGSGPVQYPEYLTYSQGYSYRVCVDLSIVALRQAQQRLGERGLCVVADVAHLPFKPDGFEGVVSLHTLHHLQAQEQGLAYRELHRVLAPGCTAVVVNGWSEAPLMRRTKWLVRFMEKLAAMRRSRREQGSASTLGPAAPIEQRHSEPDQPYGTYVQKIGARWLRSELDGVMDYRIRVWRSASTRFLRAVIHERLGGRLWLRLLFRLEELFPRWFGENGQYPLVIINKPAK
ncbi:MAG: class I SAM-dependent methyltransferase [Chloroflexi bacterium]|nr:class I SAM-dependent methyltransferase [Chloroflexota bacterium]